MALDHSLSNAQQLLFKQMFVALFWMIRVVNRFQAISLLCIPAQLMVQIGYCLICVLSCLLFLVGASPKLFQIKALFVVAIKHINVILDPGWEFFEDELISSVLHLLLELGKESSLENEEKHALLKHFILVTKPQIKLATVAFEFLPLFFLLIRYSILEMLVLLTNSFDVVFDHYVLAPLQGDWVLWAQMIYLILLLAVDDLVLEHLLGLLAFFFVNSNFKKHFSIYVIVLDSRERQLIFKRIKVSLRIRAFVLYYFENWIIKSVTQTEILLT